MQSIAGTLAAGEQAGKAAEPKVSGDLVTQLLLAHEAKSRGDTTAQQAALLRSEMAARKAALDAQQKMTEAGIKAREKIEELAQKNAELTDQGKKVNAFIQALKTGDLKTAGALAPVIKELDAALYKAAIDLWKAEQHGLEGTEFVAGLDVPGDVKRDMFVGEKRDELNEITTEEAIRDKHRRGEELTPEERAIITNRHEDENPFLRKPATTERVSPAEMLRKDVEGQPKSETRSSYDQGKAHLDHLLENDIITEEEYNIALKSLGDVGKALNPEQSDDLPTSIKEAQYMIERWRKEGVPENEITQKLENMLGASASSGRAPSSIENQQTILKRYSNDIATKSALAGLLSILDTDSKRDNLLNLSESWLKGRKYEEMSESPREKEGAARLFMRTLYNNAAGGEIMKRHMQTLDLLRIHLPELMKEIDAMRDAGIDIGRVLKWDEKVQRWIFGDTQSPHARKLQTRITNIVAAFIMLRSGAQVTEQERALYEGIFANLGQGYESNKAAIDGLLLDVENELSTRFVEGFGEEWGDYALSLTMKAPAPTKITQEEFDRAAARLGAGQTREMLYRRYSELGYDMSEVKVQ